MVLRTPQSAARKLFSAFDGVGRKKQAFGDKLFKCRADRDGFAAERSSRPVGLIRFRFFEFRRDLGEAGFERVDSFFQFGDFRYMRFL